MDKLDDIFNIESNTKVATTEIFTKSGDVVIPKQQSIDANIDYDYEKTRGNLHTLLAQGHEALMEALEIAKKSEHPRAFEVVGGLMKQLADINHQLLDLSEKRQKMTEKTENKQGPTTNNAIFVGSTTELNKFLKNMKEG